MAAYGAVLSVSKIINPFWGGRLGNTVKVRQDTLSSLSVVMVGVLSLIIIIYCCICTQGHTPKNHAAAELATSSLYSPESIALKFCDLVDAVSSVCAYCFSGIRNNSDKSQEQNLAYCKWIRLFQSLVVWFPWCVDLVLTAWG